MKAVMKPILGLAVASTVASAAIADDRVVRVYNWSDYIAEDTIEKFEAATGIKVTYDVFDSNEVLEAKVLSGQSGYDVVVPTSDYLARHVIAGAYQKLDKSKIPNWDNLSDELLANLENYDKGNQYGVPYQWGTTGIGYNVAKVEEALGEDAPTDSWDLFFNPEYASKLADCGVAVLDSPGEVLPLALSYLGLDPNSKDRADYDKAGELMKSIKPSITYFHSSRYISDLANGDICLAIGWSGDVFQAMARAEEAENGVEIAYYIPKEGTAMWSDMMAIPKDANNVDEAHEFINFVLDAQIGADITNYVWYGSPNEAAKEFIDPEILANPGIYPAEGTKLFTFEVLPEKINRYMTRTWTSVKSD
ncbi:polyamine ABC transporter substrate-binding protein [Marinobacter sp. F4216]|uniref:polyamine ABC transporter substrate-binding protein n=1 Tax=Marinobacter sp. F4216 TaxID=2874281 RepID=UPI001CBF5018|nr:polyamine ABC transporter substrate-binding protein [Marinobacter sp. F4216]MBZ2168962.1 polyamine ABC transporter substrate-binding protein [Marinobacter sp. F4216]